jgi:hypothetical protein
MIPVARRTRRPLLAHLHASYNLRGRCIFGLHHATLIAGVSRPTLQGLAEDGVPGERLRLVHNGIDFARLSQGDASGLRKSLGIGENDVVLCSIGSLIHRKGIDVLLRAFARLRREEPHLHLLVVGNGPEHDALVALSRELGLEGAAHFLGEREDPGAILRDAADIAVSASRDEGLALFVMEALSFGRPVVATNVGGTAEALEDGVTGYLVAPDDATGLADLTLRLVQDPTLRCRLGEAARVRGHEFRVEHMVDRFAALYDELLQIPPGRLGWNAPRGPLWPYLRLAGGVLGRRLGLPTA